MNALVLGFGAFGAVVDNPSSRLAGQLSDRVVGRGGHRLVGGEMPVVYSAVPSFSMEVIARVQPVFTLGIGVAMGRPAPLVERIGRNHANPDVEDNAGLGLADFGTGPTERRSTEADALAEALGVGVSDDAGSYVCNAWLYRMLGTGQRVAFLHVPGEGMPADALAEGLGRYLDGLSARLG